MLASLLSVGSFVMAGPAHAAVTGFTVNMSSDAADANPGNGSCATTSGSCSLRAAIQEMDALGQPVNNITIPAGTYTLTLAGSGEDWAATGDLDIRVPMKIVGTVGSTVIKGGTGFGDRIFDIPAANTSDVTLNGLKIQGGAAPGAENGGGLRILGTGTFYAINVTWSGNSAGGSGGGLYTAAGTLKLTIVTFSGNSAGANGGGLDLEGSVVTTNFDHLTVSNNTAFQGGGISAFVSPGATGSIPLLTMSTFTGNTTLPGGFGGGMALSRAKVATTTVSGNTASYGGGVELVGSSLPTALAGRIVISGNTANVSGGGIYTSNCGSSCGSLLHVVLDGNSASQDGSGMFVNDGLSVEKSTINANHTLGQGAYGGAVYHRGSLGALVVTNSTIGENTSGPVASGVVIDATTVDRFTNVTVGNNTGGTANGIVVTPGKTPPQLFDSIVSGVGASCTRPLDSRGHNLERGDTCGFHATGDIVNKDPILQPLADNGGGTHTMRIGSKSPAIDKGDNATCPIYDQRSGRRPWDGDGNATVVCDIGAFELGPTSANVDVGFASVVPTVSGQTVTYVMTLKNTGAFGSTDSIVTVVLPSSLQFVSCSATLSGRCEGSGNVRTISYASVAKSTSPKVTIVATIAGTGRIDAPLTVWSENTDWFPVDNTATATIQV